MPASRRGSRRRRWVSRSGAGESHSPLPSGATRPAGLAVGAEAVVGDLGERRPWRACHPVSHAHEGPELLRGSLRSRGVRRPRRLARPRLLPPGRQATRPHPCLPLGRPQALPDAPTTSSANPRGGARPDRPADREGGDRSCRLTTPAAPARLPIVIKMLCGQLPQTPRRQCSPVWTALRDRAAESNPMRGPHPIDHLVAGTLQVRAPR